MRSFIILVIIFLYGNIFSQKLSKGLENLDNIRRSGSTPLIDSLRDALIKARDKDIARLELDLFREYLPINVDSSELYINRYMNSTTMAGDSLGMVIALNGLGTIAEGNGLIKAIAFYSRALGIAKRNGYKTQVKFLLNGLTNAYGELSDFENALKYSFESLKFREANGDSLDISIAIGNIGIIYQEMGYGKEAMEYYTRSLDMKIRNHITYDLAHQMVNIGGVLNEQGRFIEAELRVNDALRICDTVDCELNVLIDGYDLLGEAFFNQGKFRDAEVALNHSLNFAKGKHHSRQGDTYNGKIGNAYYWLAKIEFEKGAFQKTIAYVDSSQKIAVNGSQKLLAKNYKLYSEVYYKIKNYKKSIDAHILFEQINLKILNTEIVNRVRSVQFRYDLQAKEEKLIAQEKIVRLQEQRIQQQLVVNLLIGIVVLLLVGLMAILILRIVKKQKINEMLDLRVRERTSELELSRDEFRHANDEKIYVLKKVSGDLTKSLASLKGLSSLAADELTVTQTTYFKELTILAEKMVGYVDQYIPDLKK